MAFLVLLTAGAERDLEGIYRYIADADGRPRADHVLEKLLELGDRLAEHPDRGAHPDELLALGIREYRQVLFKPYRVIYRIIDKSVVVMLIADGRRDMQSLLARRLLEAP